MPAPVDVDAVPVVVVRPAIATLNRPPAELPLPPNAMPLVFTVSTPVVVLVPLREKASTMLVVVVEPSSRLTPLNDAEFMMLIRLCCWALMSLCTWVALVPDVWAVTRSAFICFRMVSTLLIAEVAVLSTEAPRFNALVTALRALTSDLMLVAMDQ